MYVWAISYASFACMVYMFLFCLCFICFHYNKVDKGYTLLLMSLLCSCLLTSLHLKYSEATFFVRLGGIFCIHFHWDTFLRGSFFTQFGTKINSY